MQVDADVPASLDLFGKTVSDLQSGVVVDGNVIKGTLKYVPDYTGFSSKEEEQSGNYLAIHADDANADFITVELVGGTKGPVTLDEDRVIVLRIANKDTQSVKVTSIKNDETKDVVTLSLAKLTLEPAAEG